MYCADCGKPMRLHRTRTREEDSCNNFKCGTYSNRGKEACSGHYIRENQMKAILLDDLKERITHLAERQENLRDSITNAAKFVERAKECNEITEQTPELLRLFVEKLVERERAEKYPHSALQDAMIYYRDIRPAGYHGGTEPAKRVGLYRFCGISTQNTRTGSFAVRPQKINIELRFIMYPCSVLHKARVRFYLSFIPQTVPVASVRGCLKTAWSAHKRPYHCKKRAPRPHVKTDRSPRPGTPSKPASAMQ